MTHHASRATQRLLLAAALVVGAALLTGCHGVLHAVHLGYHHDHHHHRGHHHHGHHHYVVHQHGHRAWRRAPHGRTRRH